MIDAELQQVVEHIGSELEVLLPRLGLKLPGGVTGPQFLTEILEGAPGVDRDRAFFTYLGVKILNATLRDDLDPDLAEDLRSRIAKVYPRGG